MSERTRDPYDDRVMRVSAVDDPRVEAYARVRERDLAGREGLFIAEGEVVVRVLVGRSRFRIRSVLLAENRVAALADVIGRLATRVDVFVAPPRVMSEICGFDIHRGVLALGERGPAARVDEAVRALPGAATVVVLAGVVNHDNVGGVFRNAAAFGADLVVLDGVSCDPLYRKAIRVSAGGALVVPFARAGAALEIVDLLERADFDLFLTSPRGAVDIRDAAPRARPRRAIVLGAEGAGLPPEILARGKATRIDIAPGFDSLNVAVTSGIMLHALASSRTLSS